MGPVTAGRFVGRTAALERLGAALDAALAGRGDTVLVSGDAGIGKTRLVAEFTARARDRGCTVLSARCVDLVGAGVPYLPVVDLLRPVRDRAAFAGALSRLVPGDDPVDPPADDARLRLFEGVRGIVARLAGIRPLVVVLEDLHWADVSTLDLLAFLAHAVRDSRILIVATCRSDDPSAGDRLARLIAELVRARAVTVVALDPLSRPELDALLESLAGRLLPAELTASVYVRSEGNPFFAEELLAAADRGEPALPRAVTDAMLQRLAGLGGAARTVVRVVAAAGRDVSYRLLAAVQPGPGPDLLSALREAVEHRVLEPVQRTGSYRFRHALLAEAVYTTLLPGEREALHTRLARALHGSGGDGGSPDAVAGELAQHWAAAGMPVEALTASLRAARAAEAVSGWAEALRHLERVRDLWNRVPDPERLAGTDLATVLARAAEAAHLTGSGQRAAALMQSAIELLGEEAVRYERLGSYLLPTGDREGGLRALRRAAQLVPATPPTAERARILAALGNALRLSMRHEEAVEVCAEAIALAGAVGERSAGYRALDIYHLGLCYRGRLDDGLAGLRNACDDGRDGATPLDILCPYALRTDALIMAGRLPEAARVARDGLALARRLGVERGVGTLLAANAAEALLGLGDWTGADAVLGTALRTGGEFWSHQLHRLRAHLAIGRGEFDAAHRHLASGTGAAQEPPTAAAYACLVAELAVWEGQVEEALRAVDEGLAADPDDVAFMRARLCAVGLRASASVARHGAVPSARAEQLMREARGSARRGSGVAPDARLWCGVAECEYAAFEGRPPRWRSAAAEADALGRPYLAAYCRWRQVAALAGHGAPAEQLTGPARAAHAEAVRLGAWPLRRELELLAQRARFTLDEAVPRRLADPRRTLGLTAREDEVFGLLARGYTNREIAAELTISVKTASVHVSHILQKLGISNRAQAAAIAVRVDRDPT
jgi:DNA-binding CsgD family transcriptional regulator/tetratricopeptide (TPR) repeat protein